jgi:hypothetical protein
MSIWPKAPSGHETHTETDSRLMLCAVGTRDDRTNILTSVVYNGQTSISPVFAAKATSAQSIKHSIRSTRISQRT